MSGGADPNRSLLRRTSGPVGPQWLCPQRGIPPSPTRSNEIKLNQFARGGGGRCLRLNGASGPHPPLSAGWKCQCFAKISKRPCRAAF